MRISDMAEKGESVHYKFFAYFFAMGYLQILL